MPYKPPWLPLSHMRRSSSRALIRPRASLLRMARLYKRAMNRETNKNGASIGRRRNPPCAGFARLDAEPFPVFEPGWVWLVGAGPGAPGLMSLLCYHAMQTLRRRRLRRAGQSRHPALGEARRRTRICRQARRQALARPARYFAAPDRAGQSRQARPAAQGRRSLHVRPRRRGKPASGQGRHSLPHRAGHHRGRRRPCLCRHSRHPSRHQPFRHLSSPATTPPARCRPMSNWQAVATASPVIVMYMAVKHLGEIAGALMRRRARRADDPVTIVSNATLPQQLVQTTTLGAASDDFLGADEPPTPAIVVVGHAADWRDMLDWYRRRCGRTRLAKAVVIAAPSSGSGKTVVTLGLLRALRNRGLRVASAKVGPDYIDPRFHEAASGRALLQSRSLGDGQILYRCPSRRTCARCRSHHHRRCHGPVRWPRGSTGSTADLAEDLDLPVLLVVDAAHQCPIDRRPGPWFCQLPPGRETGGGHSQPRRQRPPRGGSPPSTRATSDRRRAAQRLTGPPLPTSRSGTSRGTSRA